MVHGQEIMNSGFFQNHTIQPEQLQPLFHAQQQQNPQLAYNPNIANPLNIPQQQIVLPGAQFQHQPSTFHHGQPPSMQQ
jgi:hypothetical protein